MFVPVGFNNYVSLDEITVIAYPHSSPIKRYMREASKENCLIDVSQGRRVKSVIFLYNGSIVLCALDPATLVGRARLEMESAENCRK